MATAYETMLSLDECKDIVRNWLVKERNADRASIQFENKERSNTKWKVGKKNKKATLRPNLTNGSANPVLTIFEKGTGSSFSLKNMLDDLEGTSDDSPTRLLMRERFHQRKNNIANSSDATLKAIEERNAKLNAEAELKNKEARRKDMLETLVGATVSQYIIVKSENQIDSLRHQGQTVKTPNEHPYITKKGFDISSDEQKDSGFYIIANFNPTPNVNNMMAFVKSDYFQLPKFAQDEKISRQDLLDHLEQQKNDFKFLRYANSNRIQSGAGVVPAKDENGVVTSLQFYPSVPEPNFTESKYCIAGAMSTGVSFTFDESKKDKNPSKIVMAEGWATAYDLNKLFRNDPQTIVVSAFTANQLSAVASQLLKKHKDAHLYIAADNDCKTMFNHVKRQDNTPLEQLRACRNTGIQAAVATIHDNASDQHRISIIAPRFNHKKISSDYQPSDFNDLKTIIGYEKLQNEVITGELMRAGERKKANRPEVEHYVEIYNKQAEYFSALYNIPVKGLTPNGNLGEVSFHSGQMFNTNGLKDEEILALKPDVKSQEQVVEVEAPKGMDLAQGVDFFNAGNIIQDNISQVYMRLAVDAPNTAPETSSSIEPVSPETLDKSVNEIQDRPANTSNIAVHVLAQTDKIESLPEYQVMTSPIDITNALYNSVLITQTIGIASDLKTKKEIENVLSTSCSMDHFLKASYALMDPTMGEHSRKIFASVVNKYSEGSEIRAHLDQINNILSESTLQYQANTLSALQDTQNSITQFMLSKHADIGLDSDNIENMLHNSIFDKGIEEKRVFFSDFQKTMHSLGENDNKWLGELSKTLDRSLNNTKHALHEKAMETDHSIQSDQTHQSNHQPTPQY